MKNYCLIIEEVTHLTFRQHCSASKSCYFKMGLPAPCYHPMRILEVHLSHEGMGTKGACHRCHFLFRQVVPVTPHPQNRHTFLIKIRVVTMNTTCSKLQPMQYYPQPKWGREGTSKCIGRHWSTTPGHLATLGWCLLLFVW